MFSDNSSSNAFSVSDGTINNSAAVLADMNTNIVAIITAINNISGGSSITDIVTALDNLNTSLGNINVSLGTVNTSINTVNSTLTTANTNTNNIHNDLFLTTGTALNASVIGGLQNVSGAIGQIQQELQAGIDPITSQPVNIAQSLINVHNDLNNYVSGSPGTYTSVGQSAFTINQALYNTGDTARISDVLTSGLLRSDFNLTAGANTNNLYSLHTDLSDSSAANNITYQTSVVASRLITTTSGNDYTLADCLAPFTTDYITADPGAPLPYSLTQAIGVYLMGDSTNLVRFNSITGNPLSVDFDA